MRPIPLNLREQLANDPFYKACCLKSYRCDGKIEFHHNLIYAGQQQNYKFCILPICEAHHKDEKNPLVGDALDRIMLSRTDLAFLYKTFPKRNWLALQNYLTQKYGQKNNL